MTNHIKNTVPQNTQKTYRKHNPRAIIPPRYVCHRCNQKGHLISDCPTNGLPEFDIVRVPKGIPKNLKTEDLPEQVEDKYIKTLLNDEITFIDTAKGIMDEFKCPIWEDIFNDPNMVSCWMLNFCRDCILQKISEENGFKCPNCSEQIESTLELIPNIRLGLLSNLYRRECILKSNIKEVEKDAGARIEVDIGDLTQDLNQILFMPTTIDIQQMIEEYETDEEDYKLIEEALGLANLEQEIKEAQSKVIPEKISPLKPSGGSSSISKTHKGIPKTMPKMNMMPSVVGGKGMQPGMMPQFNPAMIQMMMKSFYMQPGSTPGGQGDMTQIYQNMMKNSGMQPMMPFMNPDAMKSMKSRKSDRKDGDKGGKREYGRGDRDKYKKYRKRDQKDDRKDSQGND